MSKFAFIAVKCDSHGIGEIIAATKTRQELVDMLLDTLEDCTVYPVSREMWKDLNNREWSDIELVEGYGWHLENGIAQLGVF